VAFSLIHARIEEFSDESLAFLTYVDYGILDFSLIISPSTANLPYP
jgi:hypothetical protein